MKIIQIAQKQIIIALILFICTNCISLYAIGPTAAVVIAGAKIKARKVDEEKKYPRSKCPVCKGTGKVKEGDGVVEVEAECPYCVPDKKTGDLPPEEEPESLIHPPVTLEPKCEEGKCEPPKEQPQSVSKPSPKIPQKPTTIYRR